MLRLRQVRLAHPDGEVDLAAGHGGEAVAVRLEVARDQGEQVARLGERVFPFRPMPPALALASRDRVAVGEQDREARLVGFHPHPIAAEHVGPVREEGDPAEAFGLALRAQHPAGCVEAHQLGVRGRMDDRLRSATVARSPEMSMTRRAPSHPPGDVPAIDPSTSVGVSSSPSSFSGLSCSPLRTTSSIARTRVVSRSSVEVERDLRHQPVGRAIILAADGHMGRRGRRLGNGLCVGKSSYVGHGWGLRHRFMATQSGLAQWESRPGSAVASPAGA